MRREIILSEKCNVLHSYQTDNMGKCVRYIACNKSENTKNPKCPANGQK